MNTSLFGQPLMLGGDMVSCSGCEGKKTIEVQTTIFGSDEPASVTTMRCVVCDGEGEINIEDRLAIIAHENDWCKCKLSDDEWLGAQTDYYEDGEHPDCYKHHYRHRACGGITQIG